MFAKRRYFNFFLQHSHDHVIRFNAFQSRFATRRLSVPAARTQRRDFPRPAARLPSRLQCALAVGLPRVSSYYLQWDTKCDSIGTVQQIKVSLNQKKAAQCSHESRFNATSRDAPHSTNETQLPRHGTCNIERHKKKHRSVPPFELRYASLTYCHRHQMRCRCSWGSWHI